MNRNDYEDCSEIFKIHKNFADMLLEDGVVIDDDKRYEVAATLTLAKVTIDAARMKK